MSRVRRRRSDAVFTTRQVRAAHVLYQDGWSVRNLADTYWAQWGFKSPAAAARSLYHAFHAENLALRGYRAAAVIRQPPRPVDPPIRHGTGQCTGRKTNYPNLGAQCTLPAINGTVYCHQHDPSRARERSRRLVAVREARKST